MERKRDSKEIAQGLEKNVARQDSFQWNIKERNLDF